MKRKMSKVRRNPLGITSTFLAGKYIKEGLSTIKIAKLLKCHHSTVCRWLHLYNIKVRTNSESKMGDKNPLWKGTSRWATKRIWEEYWNEPVKKGYILHHIDRNPKNNEITNLALFTRSYHEKVHDKYLNFSDYYDRNK